MTKSDHHVSPYNIQRWSQHYFEIDSKGELTLNLPGKKPHSFAAITQSVRDSGLRLPVLLRFTGLLHDRVNQLIGSFDQAREQLGYTADYRVVYPIKVNQQRRVVEEIIATEPAKTKGCIGLEAGSKPELLAVLALSLAPGSTIICNGYKDREYIRTALHGQILGYEVFIIVEKANELPLILEESKRLGVTPNIGVRARLNSIGKGNWQNTGGEKSKFGLSTGQIMSLIKALQTADALDSLKLLHFHLGSQIANIRDIQKGIQECAAIYTQLQLRGVPIEAVDIGGGLGIDYDGTESRNVCSINYDLDDYALTVVRAFTECCSEHAIAHPTLISESGRALTAHHAVLLTERVALESVREAYPFDGEERVLDSHHRSLMHLSEDLQALENAQTKRSPIEIFHDAHHALEDIHSEFINGHLGMEEQALGESLYRSICHHLRTRLNPQHRDHRELIDELDEKLADKLFVNFSLFQSIPDVWGIDQIFPILPLSGLDQPLSRRAIIQDITCDSDGRIDRYVSHEGLENYLRLPEDLTHSQLLCIFLVGAYQEILGDMHNLFGDTDSVDVDVDSDGNLMLSDPIRGDSVSNVLEYVNLKPDQLMKNYAALLQSQQIEPARMDELMLAFESGLGSYTYLDPNQ